MRPIDADALKENAREWLPEIAAHKNPFVVIGLFNLIDNLADNMPTIDPVKHGKCTNESRYFHCSECGYGVMDVFEGNYSRENEIFVFEKGGEWHFCPNCGAVME